MEVFTLYEIGGFSWQGRKLLHVCQADGENPGDGLFLLKALFEGIASGKSHVIQKATLHEGNAIIDSIEIRNKQDYLQQISELMQGFTGEIKFKLG